MLALLTAKGEKGSVLIVCYRSNRLSRVVQLILDAEMAPARELSSLVERVLEPGITRYQFLDALLELSAAIARLRDKSSDSVFQNLSSIPKSELSAEINRVLGRNDLQAAA